MVLPLGQSVPGGLVSSVTVLKGLQLVPVDECDPGERVSGSLTLTRAHAWRCWSEWHVIM